MIKTILVIALVALTSNAAIAKKLKQEDMNKISSCVDTSTGYRFLFNSNTIRDMVEVNGKVTQLTLTSLGQIDMTYTSDYIKKNIDCVTYAQDKSN